MTGGKAELLLLLLVIMALFGVAWWFLVEWLPEQVERRREEREMREQAVRWGARPLPGRWGRQ